MESEKSYIAQRKIKAFFQSLPFYLFRVLPIKRNKIVFTTIEGTTGFTCNPKYIALELMRRNNELPYEKRMNLVWLVDDPQKQFPKEIHKVRNTLWNRAYELTTARFWIDNSRKQLECRKRKGQIYIQTWHAKLGFKPTCLDRGASFSKIAFLVSKHDSDMVDYWLSNSDWYDKTLKTGSLYEGKTIRCGSPRCDILVRAKDDDSFKQILKVRLAKKLAVENKNLTDIHFMMYAPTFRGGNQSTTRSLEKAGHMPDFARLKVSLEKKFGGQWVVLLRLHPQMTVRKITGGASKDSDKELTKNLRDISTIDDMYEILSACDALMTDYSSAAFDAATMEIPIFLYCDDYQEYENERGKLLWNLKEIPFPLAENDEELIEQVASFDALNYRIKLHELFDEAGITEDGQGSKVVVDYLLSL